MNVDTMLTVIGWGTMAVLAVVFLDMIAASVEGYYDRKQRDERRYRDYLEEAVEAVRRAR